MYRLLVKSDFGEKEYEIERKIGITKLAMKYGDSNDKVTLFNKYGKAVDCALWDEEHKKYIKVTV